MPRRWGFYWRWRSPDYHVIAHGGDIQRNLINAIRRGVRDHRIAPAVGFDALVVEHGDMAGARGFHQNIGVPERLAQRQTILMQHRTAAHPVTEVTGVTGVAVAQVIVSPRALVLQRGIAAVVLLRAVALVDAIEKILLPRQITTDTGTVVPAGSAWVAVKRRRVDSAGLPSGTDEDNARILSFLLSYRPELRWALMPSDRLRNVAFHANCKLCVVFDVFQ